LPNKSKVKTETYNLRDVLQAMIEQINACPVKPVDHLSGVDK